MREAFALRDASPSPSFNFNLSAPFGHAAALAGGLQRQQDVWHLRHDHSQEHGRAKRHHPAQQTPLTVRLEHL